LSHDHSAFTADVINGDIHVELAGKFSGEPAVNVSATGNFLVLS
jgi:hypothetical protein